jgi:parallel beta helix pectate lyase-like protein
MNKFRSTIKLFVIATFLLAFASIAQAQATRTWVSGVGDDANPCSRTAPCKTFAGAISKTAAGGEIDALDPGGFGAVTITKSITIDGTHGAGFGSILASATTGVIVNAAGISVTLRSLSINGAGTTTGTNGIRFLQGSKLTVEDCDIFNFTNSANPGSTTDAGIQVALATAGKVYVKDSHIYNNLRGIRATTTSGVLLLVVENTAIENNTQEGAKLEAGAFLEARNSNISYNATGVSLTGGANGGASLIHCEVIANTGTGLAAGTSGFTRIGGSSFIGNATGISQSAPNTVKTFGDNYIVDAITGGALQFIAPQ